MIVITVARKPLVGSVAANVLRYGTGSLNIDSCRIGPGGDVLTGGGGKLWSHYCSGTLDRAVPRVNMCGRWPTNLILQHLSGCRLAGVARIKTSKELIRRGGLFGFGRATSQRIGRGGADGREPVDTWECVPGCPVSGVDSMSYGRNAYPGSPNKAETYRDAPMGETTLTYWASPCEREKEILSEASYGDLGGASLYFKQVGGRR